MGNEIHVICKNVFKSHNGETLKKEFNDRWIELINQFEKNKGRIVSILLLILKII